MENPEKIQSIVGFPVKSAPQPQSAFFPKAAQSLIKSLRQGAPSVLPLMVGIAQAQTPQSVSAPLEGVYCLPVVLDVSHQLDLGQRVHQGELLGFIEVMKMRCMVQSPCSGIIQSLFVKSGQKVALDECLMVIQPVR